MAAYLIIDIAKIGDEPTYARYRSQVSSGLLSAGGRYLARGGPVEVLEGAWRTNRIVLVQFFSADAARRWWVSKDYAPLRQMRQVSTAANMILVEGATEERA